MKKYLAIILSLLLALSLFGCKEEQSKDIDTSGTNDTSDSQSSESSTERDPSLPVQTITGGITEIVTSDTLLVEVLTEKAKETWGDFVYVITSEAEQWCVGDHVTVIFYESKPADDKSQYVKLIAYEVRSLYEAYKPIIYLYPETATECSVRVALDGTLTCTYPEHGDNGWENFTAYPDGTLIFPDGMEYYALYWEGVQDTEWDMTKGFCVKGEDTAKFLEWALAEQGLTRREANEFIMYWLPRMEINEYNVISFQTEAYTDGAKLEISPSPDSLLRVFMAYYATDTEIEIQPQEFDSFTRDGFTVVEWGGTEIK